MERVDYQAIVRAHEARARRVPRMYRFGVLALAVFGTIVFHVMFVAGVALIAGGAWAVVARSEFAPILIFGAVLGVWMAIFAARALAFRFQPPVGVEATRDAAPELWRLVETLRGKLGARPIHRLLLTADHGASIAQTPRPGLIFGSRNTLTCGLPLMLTLDADQFASVVAHELGHLAGGHGKTSTWSYRVQRVWQRVAEQTQHKPQHPMARFAKWFVPRLHARSVVLCRALEHQADLAAVAACGREPAGQALLRAHLDNATLRKFWEATWHRAATERDAPVDVLQRLASATPAVDEQAERGDLSRELAVRAEPHASHPSLADRLAAIDYVAAGDGAPFDPIATAASIPLPARPAVSAARALLGEQHEPMLAAVGEAWAVDASEPWDERYTHLLMSRGRLDLLDALAASGSLSADEAFERARLAEVVEGEKRLLALVDEAIEKNPKSAPAHYLKGRVLVERHDAAGVACLEQAMTLDPTSTAAAAELLRVFHAQRNDHDAAERIAKRADDETRQIALAAQERDSINAQAEIDRHALPAADVRRTVAILRTLPSVERAYLVRRVVRHYPDVPAHALIVLVKSPWRFWRTRRQIAEVAYALSTRLRYTDLSATHFVLGHDESATAIRRRYKRRAEHCIYDARRKTTGGRV